MSRGCHRSDRRRAWVGILSAQASAKRVIFNVSCCKTQDEAVGTSHALHEPSRSVEGSMRGIISCVIAVSLFAGSSAWAAAGDDDKDARSNEKSSSSAESKPSETARSEEHTPELQSRPYIV